MIVLTRGLALILIINLYGSCAGYQPKWRNKIKPVAFKSKFSPPMECKHLKARKPVKNQKLKKAIAEYEALHRRITKGDLVRSLHRYVEEVRNIEERYIIFTATSTLGLSNRLLAIMSAFLLSLLTDRVLLVRFDDYDIDTIFCNPFSDSKWGLPYTVRWTKIQSTMNGEVVFAGRIKPSMGPIKLSPLTINEHSTRLALQGLACSGDLGEKWKNVQIIHLRSDHYFIPLILANPHYQSTLKSWFPDGNIASVLASYLFHPRDYIWQEVLDTVNRNDMLGLQVRYLSGAIDFAFMNNTVKCLDSLQPSHVLVASLHQEASKYIYEHRMWNVTHKYADGKQEAGKRQAAETVHDIWALGRCSELVVTKRSTLGYLAAAVAGRRPIFLAGREDVGGCMRAISHEPCYHQKISLSENFCEGFPQAKYPVILNNGMFLNCEDTAGIKINVKY